MNALFYASARILSTLIACVVLATILSPHFNPALKAALTSDSFAAHTDNLLITLIATISLASGYLVCRLGITKCGILPKVLEGKFFYPVFALIALCVGYFCWGYDYHQDDEVSQAVQGHIFASGQGKLPTIYCAFVTTLNMVCDKTGLYAQYPPLHSLFLALFGYPSPLLLLGIAFFISEITKRYFGYSSVKYVRFCILASPFLYILGMSYMNHVSALFFLAMAAWLFLRGNHYWAFLPLVLASQIRPFSSALLAMTLGLATLWQKRSFASALILACYAGVMLLCQLLWNFYTTGDPWLSPFIKLWGDFHLFGFRIDAQGRYFGLSRALIHLGKSIIALDVSILTFPSILIFAFSTVWIRSFRYHIGVLFASLLPAMLFFYWHNGVYAGPRLWFEWLFIFLPLFAYLLRYLNVRFQMVAKRKGMEGLLSSSIVAFSLLAVFIFFPLLSKLKNIRQHGNSLKPLLQEYASENSVYFVKVTRKERMVAELRAAGLNGSIIEMSTSDNIEFRRHGFSLCELYYLADRVGDSTDLTYIKSLRPHLVQFTLAIKECEATLREQDLKLNPDYDSHLIPLPYLVTLNTFKPGDPLVVRDLGPEKNQEFIDYLLKTEMITRDFKSFFVSADKVGDEYKIRLSERS